MDFTPEEMRSRLLNAARYVAQELWEESGEPVTAGQIYETMREAMENDPDMAGILAQHDKRWMGGVFKEGWVKAGHEPSGSHGRLVSKWVPKS